MKPDYISGFYSGYELGHKAATAEQKRINEITRKEKKMSAKFIYKELAGFYSGQRTERDYLLDFIEHHKEQGVELTSEDIANEIKFRDKLETNQRVDEIMRRWNGV
jgi:hypothetical protein